MDIVTYWYDGHTTMIWYNITMDDSFYLSSWFDSIDLFLDTCFRTLFIELIAL